MNLSVVIPTYKKTDLLIRNLDHNRSYLEGCEIIVVNDYPRTPLPSEIKETYPDITLLENTQNLGFAGAVDEGIAIASHDYILLLNSDVYLKDQSYIAALEHFVSNTALFAVSFAQQEKDESVVGKNRIYWTRGFLLHAAVTDTSFGINGWAEGGACLIDRQKYMNIGGFDRVYAPFYWEDVDLSYRAWKAGYEVVFDPDVQVEHHHESTIGSLFEKNFVQTTAYRNQFLFVWRNIRDIRFLLSHLFWIVSHLVIMTLKGEWSFIKGFWQALSKIASASPMQRFEVKRKDRYVLGLFMKK
jgi:GT2 family glycosyltransferase